MQNEAPRSGKELNRFNIGALTIAYTILFWGAPCYNYSILYRRPQSCETTDD